MNRRWTKREITDLHMLCRFKTVSEMSDYFNRSESSVKYKLLSENIRLHEIRKYRRSENKKNNTWTEQDIKILKKYKGKKTSTEIGTILGKTSFSVKQKANRLGLSLQINAWKRDHIDILFEMRGKGLSFKEISKKLKRSEGACRRKYEYYTKF